MSKQQDQELYDTYNDSFQRTGDVMEQGKELHSKIKDRLDSRKEESPESKAFDNEQNPDSTAPDTANDNVNDPKSIADSAKDKVDASKINAPEAGGLYKGKDTINAAKQSGDMAKNTLGGVEAGATAAKGATDAAMVGGEAAAAAAQTAASGGAGAAAAGGGAAAAGGPVGWAAAGLMALKNFAQEAFNDPKAALSKLGAVLGCGCGAFFLVCGLPIVLIAFLISMFANLFSNDSSKHDGPRAQSSWIYKYQENDYSATVKNKVDANPEQTFIISHNAAHQKSLIDSASAEEKDSAALDELSEEMRETSGYTDDPIMLYTEPSFSADKALANMKYGDVVVAHLPDGATEPSFEGPNGEFLAIEYEDSEIRGSHEDMYSEDMTGLENPNMANRPKKVAYIEKRLVYQKPVHDARLEYTLQDEYEMMSTALKNTLRMKIDDSVAAGNANIDAEVSNYESHFEESDLYDDEKYLKIDAAILYNMNGKIVKDLTAAENPNSDTFDASGSRSILSASSPHLMSLNQDVATILAGYSVSKADSLPDEGYYKMLDNTMKDYLKHSLKLQNFGVSGEEKTRELSYREVVDNLGAITFKYNNTRRFKGRLVVYDAETMSGLSGPRVSLFTSSSYQPWLDPKTKYNSTYGDTVPVYDGDIYLKDDLNKYTSSYLMERDYGYYKIISAKDYADLYGLDRDDVVAGDYSNSIAELVYLKTPSSVKKTDTFEYNEYMLTQTISELSVNQVVWEFFDQTGEYYPMVKDPNGTYNSREEFINIVSAESWQEKYRLTRSLPYFQQQLSYLFDNSSLANDNNYFAFDNPLYELYPGEEETIYAQIVSGAPMSEHEKILSTEMENILNGTSFDNVEYSGGYVTNYRKIPVENYDSAKMTNSAGIEAKKSYFLWIIPTGYKQEYRRASEAETIEVSRLDRNWEYITDYEKKGALGSMLPPGSVAVPVVGWENKISGGWEPNRVIAGIYAPHFALDIADARGTPIYSIFDGVVIKSTLGVRSPVVSRDVPATTVYVLNEETGIVAAYLHGSPHESDQLVKEGDRVVAGQEIMKMDTTGFSTGDHLHLQIYKSRSDIRNDASACYNVEDFLNANIVTVAENPNMGSIDDSDNESPYELDHPLSKDKILEADESGELETVTMSVGNKMDYWFDNIMTHLSDDDIMFSGNGGQSVADLAMSYLGDVGGLYFRREFWGSYAASSPYVNIGGVEYHWCAAFVSIILRDAGFGDLAPYSAGVASFVSWGRTQGNMYPDDGTYIPKPGDLIIYDWEGDGLYDHIGFIYSADSSGYKTIEGNTGGPGSSDSGGWKGVVNSHDRSYNSSKPVKFLSIAYPDLGSVDQVIAEYAKSALGSNFGTVDEYGRIGIGLWHGSQARSLLNKIKNQNSTEVSAIIAESEYSSEINDFLNGSGKFTKEIVPAVKKMLALPTSKTIQNQHMQDRIKTILDNAAKESNYGTAWNSVDAKSQVYLVMVQLIMDSYGERNWLFASGTKTAVNSAIDKEGVVDTFVSELGTFISSLGNSKNTNYLEYNDWTDIAEYKAAVNQNSWKALYRTATSKVNSAASAAKSIPEDRLMMGLGNGKVFNLPDGLGRTKTYMGNHMLSGAYKQGEIKRRSYTGEDMVARVDGPGGRMVIAMYAGPPGNPKGYGSVGDMVDILLSDGVILHAVIGDAKNLEGDASAGDSTNLQYGVHHDGSIIEFVLNTQTIGRYPDRVTSFTNKYPGYVKKVVNLGPLK